MLRDLAFFVASCSVAMQRVPILLDAGLRVIDLAADISKYARINTEADFQALCEERHAKEKFVDVLPARLHSESRSVRSADVCGIALFRLHCGDTLVFLVIDNLVKGRQDGLSRV